MTNNDIRRFFATGKLTENFTKSDPSISSLADIFEDLSRLYEEDETVAQNKDPDNTQDAAEETTAIANIKDIQKEVQNLDISDKNIKLQGKADTLYDQLIAQLQTSKLADAVEILELVAADPKLSLLLRHGFSGGSGEDASVAVNIEKGVVPVAKMRPTQKEIGTDGSLKNILTGTHANGKVEFADYFKDGAVASMPGPFVYKDGDLYYIIDGHHRWSQTYCLNPQASLNCQVLTSNTQLTVEEVLKNFQAAIAADQQRQGLGRKPFAGKNFFKFATNAASIIDYFKDMQDDIAEQIAVNATKASPEAVQRAVNLYGNEVKNQIQTENEHKKTAIAWLTRNALALAKNAEADKNPTRLLMPQSDDNTFEIVKDTLAIGK